MLTEHSTKVLLQTFHFGFAICNLHVSNSLEALPMCRTDLLVFVISDGLWEYAMLQNPACGVTGTVVDQCTTHHARAPQVQSQERLQGMCHSRCSCKCVDVEGWEWGWTWDLDTWKVTYLNNIRSTTPLSWTVDNVAKPFSNTWCWPNTVRRCYYKHSISDSQSVIYTSAIP